MVTYLLEEINDILLPVYQVPGRTKFFTLWQLSQDLQECLGNMEHPDHLDEGYVSYMMKLAANELYSITRCQDPDNLGNYFIVTATAINDTEQKP